MQKKIIWEPWRDPFKAIVQSSKTNTDEDEDMFHEYNEAFHQDENIVSEADKQTGPVLVGPMGIIPLNEHNVPSKIYNLWMIHTNFNISESVVNVLQNVPGIETLDVYSRYRARIAIGKLFKQSEVRTAVDDALCKEIVDTKMIGDSLPTNIETLRSYANTKYKFWAILVLDNNEVVIVGNDTQANVEDKMKKQTYSKAYKSWTIK
jgi:hypothetical protein